NVQTLIAQATHVNTWRRHRIHTRRPEVVCGFVFCIDPIPDCPSSRTPGAVGSARGPGEVRYGRRVFCSFACFFCWAGGNPLWTQGEHANSTQKGPEIAHMPPRANSAPCGNRTHDLPAVKRQCKHLSPRGTTVTVLLFITNGKRQPSCDI